MDGIKDYIFKFLKIDNLIDHLTGYVEDRVELFKIEIKDEVARVIAKGLVLLVVALAVFMALFFLSFSAALYINTWFQDSYAGFLLVAGIYLIAFILILIFRKDINQSIARHMADSIRKSEMQ